MISYKEQSQKDENFVPGAGNFLPEKHKTQGSGNFFSEKSDIFNVDRGWYNICILAQSGLCEDNAAPPARLTDALQDSQ